VSTLLERAQHYVRRELWQRDLSVEPFYRKWPMHVVRCVAMAVERGLVHQLPIRASALTFVTVLSLVPSLAFVFSIAKSLGQDQFRTEIVEPFLEDMFGSDEAARSALPGLGSAAEVGGVTVTRPPSTQATDGSGDAASTGDAAVEDGKGPELRAAIEKVLEFVENTDVKGLGALGFLVIVSAVIRLLGGIEEALNLTWSVERPRRLIRKIADYLAIVVVAPLLAMFATATTAALGSSDSAAIVFLRENLGFGPLIVWISQLLPLVTMLIVFTLVYLVMPNTKVRLRSAIVGGIAAAILWFVVQKVHVQLQIGVANYNKIYAGFAAFPIFLAWLWSSWLVVLSGAEFGYADQHQQAYRREALTNTHTQAWFEFAVLRSLARIVDAFQRGVKPPTLIELADETSIPEARLEEGLATLERAGVLLRAGESGEDVFALARPPEKVSVHDLLAHLRGVPELERSAGEAEMEPHGREFAVKNALDRAMHTAYSDATDGRGDKRTLAELVPQQDS
jgi:membrane protein